MASINRPDNNEMRFVVQLNPVELTLGDAQINSLAFLSRSTNLAELNLRNIPVVYARELGNLTSLTTISLVDIPMVDISPLLSLTNLKSVSLLRTPARADVISELERRGVKVIIN
jgi:Leucine-rich repeat (LRR) protein